VQSYLDGFKFANNLQYSQEKLRTPCKKFVIDNIKVRIASVPYFHLSTVNR
jgi:hypothetical protein